MTTVRGDGLKNINPDRTRKRMNESNRLSWLRLFSRGETQPSSQRISNSSHDKQQQTNKQQTKIK